MHWVLIFVIYNASMGRLDTSVTSIIFNSKQSCLTAESAIQEKWPNYISTLCVSQGPDSP